MPQPRDPFLTSAGWSLNELLTRGRRFREIPRVSVSDQNLELTIRQHEASGVPLVIEGMHEHETWPTATFDIQWLRDNSKQRELSKMVEKLGSDDTLARDTGQKRP
jgi:hypothetical protein